MIRRHDPHQGSTRRLDLLFGLLAIGIVFSLSSGCTPKNENVLKLATTTSTANTGLLDVLTEEFLSDTGIRVDFIVTGTGKALAHGREGDVDAVLVHAPAAEEAFVNEGYGAKRVPLMWNDFVIAGPPADPARIAVSSDVTAALKRLIESRAAFISRGDDSGTHKKELELWRLAGLEPEGDWYVDAGQGMGACLTMAHEMQAYVLSDRGTYLSRRDALELAILFEGGNELVNPYAIIAISPDRFPSVNSDASGRLIDWLLSPRAKALIEDYRVNGERLFHLFEDEDRPRVRARTWGIVDPGSANPDGT